MIACLSVSCGPVANTRRQDRPDTVSPDSLVLSFRGRQSPYLGRMVRVELLPGTFKIARGHTCWLMCEEPAIRFATTVPDTGGVVTGTCVGIVRDDVERCGDTRQTWYVLVDDCTVEP